MQQPLPTTPQPLHENRYPDCLHMELEATPVKSNQIDLPVTIHFNEQWEPLLNGRVKFGLKGGELKLKLENGQIPYESRHLTERIELSIQNQTGEIEAFHLPSVCQVTSNNSESNPTWEFELKMNGSVLRGSIQKENLGTLNLTDKPCYVEATFEVSQRYVHLTDAEEIYPEDISRNKQIVLEIIIRKHLLEKKLQPYLSRAELHYD
ncbi:hypothetical protein IQ276_028840 [Desmonostoc muscorum LEGE 12446]|uniref:Uncharacterized protein n=1 Tax=Desmonostoc muscorum LEGE 12446 TaxID=1828758 RepID=A0A8J6ZUA1_DESMC|nr:hypothetical protein [Desmonostoc muscorum]MCF2150366.1 hypothetical protein [Desmonostoc muscorum LEGE 12446]